MQDHYRKTRRERLDLRLSRAERDALEALAAARRTTLTGALVELVLAATPREPNVATLVESRPGRTAGRAVEVTA